MKETLPSHINRFRLGLYTADITQPISLMRVMGPFAAMARADRRLELVLPPLELPDPSIGRAGGQRLNWDWIVQCDAIFMLHPEHDHHIKSAALAWELGVPLWAEYVDDIFNVDSHNPGWKQRQNIKALRDNVRWISAWSSAVTCVSEYNRQAILDGLECDTEKIRDKFLVIPEGCMWRPSDLPRKKVVSWRGLGSHGQDVEEAMPHVKAAAKAFPDWTWMFSGDPEILEEFGRQLSPICGPEKVLLAPAWPSPFDMIEAWKGQAPYLHVVPLADNKFNKSKSHLAWLEATAVGAAVIVPDHLPEWQQPGTIAYHHSPIITNGGNSLSEILMREMVLYKEGEFHPNVALAKHAIYPALTLDTMNQRRWAILRKLCENKPQVVIEKIPELSPVI